MGKMTIDDIARELGVSKTTVSRAISGKGRIGEPTRTRVLDYIRLHGYVPSAVARGLAQNKTFNIAVISAARTDVEELPFFQKCLLGIGETVASRNYDMLVSLLQDGELANIRRIISHRKADGFILMRTLVEDSAAELLDASGLPVVAIGKAPCRGMVSVDNDNYSACLDLTRRLIRAGVRRPALIGGDRSHMVTRTRIRSFLDALASENLAEDPSLLFMDVMTGGNGEAHLSQVLRTIAAARADAVICLDDRLSALVVSACAPLGIRVPEDLPLVSYYDSPLLERLSTPVTAIYFDAPALGKTAADCLLSLIDGGEAGSIVLGEYEIRKRASTAGLL